MKTTQTDLRMLTPSRADAVGAGENQTRKIRVHTNLSMLTPCLADTEGAGENRT